MKGEGRRVNSGASNYGGLRTEHWGQDYSQLDRMSIGSGQDCCRLGAGFPYASTRGRIPVSPEQEIPVGSGQDFPSAWGKISVGSGQEDV